MSKRRTMESNDFKETFYHTIKDTNSLYHASEELSKEFNLIEFMNILAKNLELRLAFVGVLYPQEKWLKILASAGEFARYMDDDLKLPINPDPSGKKIAIKTLDVDADPYSASWKEVAERSTGILNASFKLWDGTKYLISIHSKDGKSFPQEEYDLLSNIANNLKIFLENRKRHDELEKVKAYQAALENIQQKLLEIPSPLDVCSFVVDTFKGLKDICEMIVAVPQEEDNSIFVLSSGKDEKEIEYAEFQKDKVGLAYHYFMSSTMFRSGKVVIVSEKDGIPEMLSEYTSSVKVKAVGGWPFFTKGESIPKSLLMISSKDPYYFSDYIVNTIDQLVTSMSLVIMQYEYFKKYEWSSLHDFLTDLPNRAYFERSVLDAMGRVRRENKHLAIGIMDLDNFKDWNDTLGHPAGDELLKKVALNIKSAIRGGDGVARLGGDEFGFHIAFEKIQELELVSERLMLATSITSKEGINITCSIGWAIYPEDGNNFVTLFANADRTLYSVKQSGKNNYAIFNKEISFQFRKLNDIRASLSKALDDGAIYLFLQPKIDAVEKMVIGAELLARWKVEDKLLDAKDFISSLEGDQILTDKLNRYVILKVKKLKEKGEYRDLNLSFNCTMKYFLGPYFLKAINGLNGEGITIEVKSEPTNNVDKFIERAQILKNSGFKIALDGYRTEYESITFIADEIHIDREVMGSLQCNMKDFTLIASSLQIEKLLGIRVLGEGIEDEKTLELWMRMGGRYIQGNFISRPLNEDEFDVWFNQTHEYPYFKGLSSEDLILLYYVFTKESQCYSQYEYPLRLWFKKRRALYGNKDAFKNAARHFESRMNSGYDDFKKEINALYIGISKLVDNGSEL
jgi:diguanylate cyclase (GGDEF)-like protein